MRPVRTDGQTGGKAMVQDYPQFCMELHVRHGETGIDGRVRLSSVADWFQEAAALNAADLGFGDELVFSKGMTWILTRLILYIDALPPVGQKVRIRTWPAKMDHLGHRGYEVQDADGKTLIRATSAWAVMDLQSRRIVTMPDDLLAAYPSKTLPCEPFSSRVLPRLREAENAVPVIVRDDDMDMNGHVNNVRYLGWLLEGLVSEDGSRPIPSMIDLSFRAECFPGERLLVRSARAGGEQEHCELIQAIVRESGEGGEVCRAVTRWNSWPVFRKR